MASESSVHLSLFGRDPMTPREMIRSQKQHPIFVPKKLSNNSSRHVFPYKVNQSYQVFMSTKDLPHLETQGLQARDDLRSHFWQLSLQEVRGLLLDILCFGYGRVVVIGLVY